SAAGAGRAWATPFLGETYRVASGRRGAGRARPPPVLVHALQGQPEGERELGDEAGQEQRRREAAGEVRRQEVPEADGQGAASGDGQCCAPERRQEVRPPDEPPGGEAGEGEEDERDRVGVAVQAEREKRQGLALDLRDGLQVAAARDQAQRREMTQAGDPE